MIILKIVEFRSHSFICPYKKLQKNIQIIHPMPFITVIYNFQKASINMTCRNMKIQKEWEI